MEKTQEILKHLFDLYNDAQWSEKDILNWCQKNTERYSAWEKAFKYIELETVFYAIDNYWRYKSNKTQPTIAKLLAMIATGEAHKAKQPKIVRYYNPANDFMAMDIKLGRCKHIISDYQRAVEYIINDMLCREMPASEWAKLDYSDKVKQAQEKGLFNELDEVLEKLCASENKQC
ncbi:MAG: hypothetical protein IJ532_07120 [Alphaproteobacteria bacterium]|nr:hypothetical protein [Alphaproteobacteria bacterium]